MSEYGGRRSGGGARGHQEATAAVAVPRAHTGLTSLGGLERMVGYAMRRAMLWMIQDFRRALRDLDMTPGQFSVLCVINANPGLSQARVAEALSIERARLVQMIDRLEAMGRVQRERSATDRRSHALYLTVAGEELIARAQGALKEHERNITERIGAQNKDDLMRILAPFLT